MGNVTLLDDNKALVASGRERDAILHRRCHLIECLGCRIVKMTSVDNAIGLALAEALRHNTNLHLHNGAPMDRGPHVLHVLPLTCYCCPAAWRHPAASLRRTKACPEDLVCSRQSREKNFTKADHNAGSHGYSGLGLRQSHAA